jgi:hypothetical protein
MSHELSRPCHKLTPLTACSELDIRGMVMVDVVLEDLHLPATLDEFCTAQQTRLDDIMDALFTDWMLKVSVAHPDAHTKP